MFFVRLARPPHQGSIHTFRTASVPSSVLTCHPVAAASGAADMRVVTAVGGITTAITLWLYLAGPVFAANTTASSMGSSLQQVFGHQCRDVPAGLDLDDQAGQWPARRACDPSGLVLRTPDRASRPATTGLLHARRPGVPYLDDHWRGRAGRAVVVRLLDLHRPGGPNANPDFLLRFVRHDRAVQVAAQVVDPGVFSKAS